MRLAFQKTIKTANKYFLKIMLALISKQRQKKTPKTHKDTIHAHGTLKLSGKTYILGLNTQE